MSESALSGVDADMTGIPLRAMIDQYGEVCLHAGDSANDPGWQRHWDAWQDRYEAALRDALAEQEALIGRLRAVAEAALLQDRLYPADTVSEVADALDGLRPGDLDLATDSGQGS